MQSVRNFYFISRLLSLLSAALYQLRRDNATRLIQALKKLQEEEDDEDGEEEEEMVEEISPKFNPKKRRSSVSPVMDDSPNTPTGMSLDKMSREERKIAMVMKSFQKIEHRMTRKRGKSSSRDARDNNKKPKRDPTQRRARTESGTDSDSSMDEDDPKKDTDVDIESVDEDSSPPQPKLSSYNYSSRKEISITIPPKKVTVSALENVKQEPSKKPLAPTQTTTPHATTTTIY